MSQTDAAIAADLALAGLAFIERISTEVRPPLPPNLGTASCSTQHGRFDSEPDEIAHVDDPDMPAKVNTSWWRLAGEFGLLDEQREFLLSIVYRDPDTVDEEYAWARVRLADQWDLAASGATALRSNFGAVFTERYVPEFTMMSLDRKMILNTTVWGDATVSTIVIRPDRIPLGRTR